MRYTRYGKISDNGRYYVSVNYPQILINNFDFFTIIVNSTDRLDLLAKQYFNNSKLWWLIALINALPGDSVMVQAGTVLFIPRNHLKYV